MVSKSRENFLGQWWRVGGAAGIIFVVLFIVGLSIQGDTTQPDDSAAEIRQYFADNDQRYMIGDLVLGAAFLFFFLPFASALRAFLGRAEGSAAAWSRLVFAGALLFAAVGAATSWMYGAIAYSAADFADDNLLKTLVNGNHYTFTTIVPFTSALMVLSASVVILQTRALWPWFGWYGVVLAVVAGSSAFAILDDDPMGPLSTLGFITFIGLGLWIVAAGVGLMMQTTSPEALERPIGRGEI